MRKRLGLPKIPKEEQWLWEDPITLSSVMRGLEDAIQGRITKIDDELLQDEEPNIDDEWLPWWENEV